MQDKTAGKTSEKKKARLNEAAKAGWLSGSDSKKKVSLRLKVFSMCVTLVAATILIYALLGITQFRRFASLITESGKKQDKLIEETTTGMMRSIAAGNFEQYVNSDAKVIDGEFWTMKHDMELLAAEVKNIMEYPEKYGEFEISPPEKKDAGKLTGQLLFTRSADKSDKEMMSSIRRLAGLQDAMKLIVEKNDAMHDCIICIPEGASIYMDAYPEQKVGSKGQILPFDADRRPWYVGAVLNRDTYFAPTNYDYFNDSMETMIGVPVYVDGKLVAVCGASRTLSNLKNMIDEMSLNDDSYICLVNETGNIVFSQRNEGELAIDDDNRGSLLNSSNTELVDFIGNALEGDRGIETLTIDGEPTFLAYAPLETVGWTLLLGITEESLEKPSHLLVQEVDQVLQGTVDSTRTMARQAQMIIILIAVVLIALAAVSSLRHAGRLVKPITDLRNAGLRFIEREGVELDHAPDYFGQLALYTGDEIEDLWVTMQDLEINVVTSVRSLRRVTAEKERIDTELSVATKIQSDMLPKIFPAFPERNEFDLYSTMNPAKEVGGDFYDFFLIDDDHLALVMADVSGKGVPAALFMVIAKTIIKNVALSERYSGPGEMLYDVNNKLCEGNDESMFVTAWLGILTISTGHLVSASGGHEYPVLCRKGGEYEFIKDVHGPGLGMYEDVDFEEWEGDLSGGDILFLYTDGVPEATNAELELFGEERMMEALNDSRKDESLEEMLATVRKHVDDFVGDAPQFDDLTMTIFSYRGREV